MLGKNILMIMILLVLSFAAHTAELPQGLIRHGDIIYPASWQNILARRDSSALQATVKSLIGERKGIVICYQWPNRLADTLNHRPEDYQEIFFSTGTYPTGSLNDYFLENSAEKFSIAGDVTRWYTAGYNYSISGQYGWIDDAVAQADPDVDFSQYDSDGDNIVDIVYLLHSGPAGEETGNPNDPWSWAWIGGAGVPTNDGVIVDVYTLQPEEHGDGSFLGIGVTRHETGHILGQFPDLYDYDQKLDTTTYYTPGDYNDHPVQDWCSMGYGGYGLFSYRYSPGPAEHPTHYCGLFKYMVDWIEPIVLDHSQPNVMIYSTELHDSTSLYRIPINGLEWEYFLIENRHSQHAGLFDHLDSDYSAFFEFFTPGSNPLDAGLIISHIDEAMSNSNYWGFNDGTPSKPHYGNKIMDAGYDPATPWNGTEFTEFWYPYECQVGAAFALEDGQAYFTPYTTPNTSGYAGLTGIWITNISYSGDIMTFDFYLESDPPVFAYVYRWPDTLFTGPYPVMAIVLDPYTITADSLYYAVNNSGFIPVAHDSMYNDSVFYYTIPYVASLNDSITYYVIARDNNANRGTSGFYAFHIAEGGISDQTVQKYEPNSFQPLANRPNPFSSFTTIDYELNQTSFTKLEVYDVLGRLATTLVNQVQACGKYSVNWDGSNAQGRNQASGIYFLRLTTDRQFVTRQMLLLK